MQIAIVGLGRMGANITQRLLRAGHDCVVFDIDPDAVNALAAKGAQPSMSLDEMVGKLTDGPRAVWLMLPAGQPTEHAVNELSGLLDAGDVIIDGGNSFYKDSVRRAASLEDKGIDFVDCGTSGGVWGLERGYCMMIGGPKKSVDHLDPIFAALAPGMGDIPRTQGRDNGDPRVEQGYIHAGPTGSGHFVKMVHNGIEYGIMQAYAEGLDILKGKNSSALGEAERFDLNLPDVAEVWRRGSVISSWLLDLTAEALATDPELSAYSGTVPDSGEGRWTIEAAIEEAVPADVLTTALFARFRSRTGNTYGEKALSAMRAGFGGHKEPQKADPSGNKGK